MPPLLPTLLGQIRRPTTMSPGAGVFTRVLLPLLKPRETHWREQIASGQRDVRERRAANASEGRVTPAAFFAALERLLEVAIDYSRKTYFTRGGVATKFWRLPMAERVRMLGRALTRRMR